MNILTPYRVLFLLAAYCIASCLTGCTATSIKTEHWSLSRVSIGQKMEVPALAIAADGSASLAGYKSDGGSDSLSAAVTAAIKALK